MKYNMIKLNDDKTELIIFGSSFSTRKIPSLSLQLGDVHIRSSDFVRNVGAFLLIPT